VNELALFAGAGGGILGGILCGFRTVCAVEIDPFCREVLLRRQMDGCLPRFPIWDDIRTFDGRPWRGKIDIITGGFPCQPFSSASRGRVVAKDLWPEMLRVIRKVSPVYVMAENVKSEPIQKAADDLSGIGYMVRCARISASCVGAAQRRERFWLVANSHPEGQYGQSVNAEVGRTPPTARGDWWASNRPDLLGVDDGVAHRVDRLGAIGNGQVPAVVRLFLERILT